MIFETDWCSIYRFKTHNVGDIMCSPSLYFDFPKNKKIDILDSDFYNGKNCIVGGGGIIHFNNRIKEILHNCKRNNKKMIMWGAGHNIHKKTDLSFDNWMNDIDLVGIRDFTKDFEWVPCSSCMHKIFDKNFEIKRDFAFYGHYAIDNENVKFEVLNNENFENAITYLAESEYVITNSYHGVYWATLLKRKVIAYPFSTKFMRLKHPPILLNNEDWKEHLVKSASYPGALEECREANVKFYDKCKKLFD